MEKRKKVRVIHDSEVLPDGWLDTISAEIPLDNIGDAASNTFFDWAKYLCVKGLMLNSPSEVNFAVLVLCFSAIRFRKNIFDFSKISSLSCSVISSPPTLLNATSLTEKSLGHKTDIQLFFYVADYAHLLFFFEHHFQKNIRKNNGQL